jgi:hypothetical protein
MTYVAFIRTVELTPFREVQVSNRSTYSQRSEVNMHRYIQFVKTKWTLNGFETWSFDHKAVYIEAKCKIFRFFWYFLILLKSWLTQNFITIKTSWNTND